MTCTSACVRPSPGTRQCHCGAETRSAFALLPVRDGDAGFLPEGDAQLHESPVHGGGIVAKLFADLVGAKPGLVEPSSVLVPLLDDDEALVVRGMSWPGHASVVNGGVFRSGQRPKILWSVVGPDPVEVVNVLTIGDPTVMDAVLVGFDVRLRADPPPESDVSVVAGIPVWRTVRYLLTGGEGADGSRVSAVAARTAEAFLSGARDLDTAHAARFRHTLILQVRTLCHITFGGLRGFDAHRYRGACRTPAELGMADNGRGVWRVPVDEGERWWPR